MFVPRLPPTGIRRRDPRHAVRLIGLAAGLAVAAVLAGWLIANGETRIVLAVLIPLPAVVIAMSPRALPLLAGLLMLVILNGIPGVSLGGRLPTGIRVPDVAVMALALLLFSYRDRSAEAGNAPYMRAARIWGACLVAWWAITLARSVLLQGIPIRYAILYGRDFLYFAILLPLALGARLPARSLRIAALVVFVGAIAYATGQAVAGLTGVTLSWLVHPAAVSQSVGLTRFYSPMNYVVDSCLIFAGALWWAKDGPINRWLVGGVLLVLLAAATLGATRANYFAIVVGLVACAIVYAIRHGSVTSVLVRGLIAVLVVVAAATLLTAITGGSSFTANPIASRVTKGLSDVSQSSGTFGYRQHLDGLMLQVLGGQWPIGLGFLHPAAHYVPTLPKGAIRNTDTGVFNVLMTMGLVGALLVYAPLVYGFRQLLRISRRSLASSQSLPRWILYGGVAWLAWGLAGSPTLDLIFSTPGVVVAALVLAALGRTVAESRQPSPSMAAAPPPPLALDHGARGAAPPVRRKGPSGVGGNGIPRRSLPGYESGSRRQSVPSAENGSRRQLGPSSENGSRRQPGPSFENGSRRQPVPSHQNGTRHQSVATHEGRARRQPVAGQISAVIVTHNSAHCVRACIKALRTVLGHCEVIVVDNMSVDATVSAVTATDERVRVISMGRNAGYGSACNSGVRAATSEYVMVMNPDVLLDHGDLGLLEATFAQTPFGLIAPGLRSDRRHTAQPQTFGRSSWLSELGTQALGPFRPRALPRRSPPGEIESADWASGALMLVRRSEFLELGGFDERFFLYYEDQELGIRYRDAGLPIRGTDAVTGSHRGGQSVAQEDDQRVDPMAWCLLGWLEFVALQHGPRRARLSWAAIRTTHSIGRRLAERGALSAEYRVCAARPSS